MYVYLYVCMGGTKIHFICTNLCLFAAKWARDCKSLQFDLFAFATKQCKHIRTHFYVCVCVCVYKKIVVATLWPAVFTTALRLLCLLVVVVFLQK